MAKEPTTRIEDRARLGPNAAALKAKLRPSRWRKIVRDAHRKGFTVESYINTALPDELKARTKSSLRKQALETVKAAYAPAAKELDDEDRRIRALDEKRAVDERHFQEWLTAKSDRLMSEARVADQTLSDRQKEIADSVAQTWSAARAASADAVAAQPGLVSDPADSKALASLADAEKRSTDAVANQRAATAQAVSTGEKTMGITQAANLAALAAQQAKRQGETWSALGKVSDGRAKLRLDQAADAAKEVSRLLDNEVTKAQQNREFEAVAAELDLKQFTAQTEAKQKDREFDLAKDKFNLDRWIASNKQKAEEAKLELGYDKIRASQGKAAADRAFRRWVETYRARNRRREDKDGNKSTSSDRRYSSDQIQTVETVKAELERLHRKYPKGSSGQGKSFREIMLGRGYSNSVIDVAEDLRRNNGKLSRRGREKARSIGILNPDKHFG